MWPLFDTNVLFQTEILSLDTMDYGHRISKLIGKKLNETMIHSLTILTVLRLLSDAKITCTRGHVTYERIPDHRLIGFQEKMVSQSHLLLEPITPQKPSFFTVRWHTGSNSKIVTPLRLTIVSKPAGISDWIFYRSFIGPILKAHLW